MAKQIIIWVLVILVLIIMIQNTRVVTVKLLFWNMSVAQIVIILGAFLLGLATGYSICARGLKSKKAREKSK